MCHAELVSASKQLNKLGYETNLGWQKDKIQYLETNRTTPSKCQKELTITIGFTLLRINQKASYTQVSLVA